MRNKLIITILIASALVGQTAKAQLQFQKYFSDLTQYQQLANSAVDNTYVIAVSTTNKEGSDFSVVKIDTHGEIIWSKTYPSPNEDYLSAITIAPSGDIWLGGYKLHPDGHFDFSLMKLNASGNLQWYKTYGTASLDMAVFTGITTAGDVFLVGNTETDTDKHIWVLKINTAGAVIWSKMYGSASGKNINALAAAVTKDGGITVFGNDNYKSYLMKINPEGTTALSTLHNAVSDFEGIASLKQTSDEGFIFCGKIKDCTLDLCTYRFAMMKLDASGNVIWSKHENQKYTGEGKAIVETADGGFVFIGQLSDAASSKLVLIKTDAKGTLLWAKTYGRADSYGEYASMVPTTDAGFAFFGYEDSKALFVKSNANGNTYCNEQILNPVFVSATIPKSGNVIFPELNDASLTVAAVCTENQLSLQDSLICNVVSGIDYYTNTTQFLIYPNPFKESAVLEIVNHDPSIKELELSMYDVFGRKISAQLLPLNSDRIIISRENIPKGIYFYNIRNGNLLIGTGKMIAE